MHLKRSKYHPEADMICIAVAKTRKLKRILLVMTLGAAEKLKAQESLGDE